MALPSYTISVDDSDGISGDVKGDDSTFIQNYILHMLDLNILIVAMDIESIILKKMIYLLKKKNNNCYQKIWIDFVANNFLAKKYDD